jgi:NADH:ubiquinone oxidoreductase subunit 5 (subunit L)/multisubunit Na+/H+ antiporter MnhA subunit
MVLSCGLSFFSASLFHLFNHAFFKALLFLSAGSIIHILSGEQDIRKMGALAKLTPYVYMSMLVASLALAGFPFLAGFYSKDFIIEAANNKF